MSELETRSEHQALEMQEPNGLASEAVDERPLAEARERMAARVRLVWNSRRFLIRVVAWGLVLSTVVAFLVPKRYTTTARLMPPDQSSGTGAMLATLAGRAGGLAGLAESAMGLKTTDALFVEILKSNTVRDDVVHKFHLQKAYGTRFIEDTRRALTSHTDISDDRKSGVVTISLTDRDPQRAAAMVQEYVNELNWVVSHQTSSSAHRERVFLEQRLAQVKQELETAENNFGQFASKNIALDVPQQGKAMVTAAATLQGQMIAAESELEGLRQIYKDNDIHVRATEARVNKLRGALENLAGKGASEQSTIGDLYPSLRELPLLGVTYADLLRRTKVEEAVFETLTQEYELAKVEEAREIPTVKVLDPPAVPQKKSFPPRLLIMALVTMLALVLGLSWVLAKGAWETVDPTDPLKTVATEVWGDVRTVLPWELPNGSGLGQPAVAGWLRKKFRSSRVEKTEASGLHRGPENGGSGETKQEEEQE